MTAQPDPPTRLRRRLETAVAEVLDDTVSWQVTADSQVTLQLPDRELMVECHDGPTGSRWTVVLSTDGDVVSKYGQFAAVDAVLDQVRSLLDADVRYTVCCDG